MTKPKGGRGIKAPYRTAILRVPLPLMSSFKTQLDEYRELLDKGVLSDRELYTEQINKLRGGSLSKNQAIDKARQVLKQKKSARVSLEKLLQLLFDDSSITL
jgi:hypothetical protein